MALAINRMKGQKSLVKGERFTRSEEKPEYKRAKILMIISKDAKNDI